MYAARTIPFGLAAALLPFWHRGPAVAWVLVVAEMIQIADVGVAIQKRDHRMHLLER